MLDAGYWILDAGCLILDPGFPHSSEFPPQFIPYLVWDWNEDKIINIRRVQ